MNFWAKSVEQAHHFEHPVGTDDEPWGVSVQRSAAKIYRDVLPADYLQRLSCVFLGCASTMENHPIPGSLAGDWQIVLSYLRNAAHAPRRRARL